MDPFPLRVRKWHPVHLLLLLGCVTANDPIVLTERHQAFRDFFAGEERRNEYANLETEVHRRKRRKLESSTRTFETRLDWKKRLDRLSDFKFRRRYRMTKACFKRLCTDIRPNLDAAQKYCSVESYVAPELLLSIALRFLAGSSYLDNADIHNVDESTVYRHLWRVVNAINAKLVIKYDVSDEAEVGKVEAGIRANSKGRAIKGVVGAIDGLIIKIRRPSDSETPHVKKIQCSRKACYALNLQAIVDSTGRFLDVDISTVGSANDSLAWQYMDTYSALMRGLLKKGYFLIGDAAYGACEFITSPFTGASLTEEKDNYNYAISSLRIIVECAFGRLVGRWGILWKPLRFHYAQCIKIVMCVCKLHNLIISHDISEIVKHSQNGKFVSGLVNDCCGGHTDEKQDSRAAYTAPPKFDKDGIPVALLTSHYKTTEAKRQCPLRDSLVLKVKQAGIVRPRPNSIYI